MTALASGVVFDGLVDYRTYVVICKQRMVEKEQRDGSRRTSGNRIPSTVLLQNGGHLPPIKDFPPIPVEIEVRVLALFGGKFRQSPFALVSLRSIWWWFVTGVESV